MTDVSILIDHLPGETRIARVEGDALVELEVLRAGAESLVGAFYLGRVRKIVPGIAAAFVDIGLERDGFLGLAEARPPGVEPGRDDKVTDYMTEGDAVLVQVETDPVPGKGAKVTTHATLPGRYLVHTPGKPGLRRSRRIPDGEGARLLALLEESGEGGEAGGFIVRTAAEGAEGSVIGEDAKSLREQWRQLREAADRGTPPLRLAGDDPIERALTEAAGPGSGVARVVFEDREQFERARSFVETRAPELAGRLYLHDRVEALFEAEGVEARIEEALDLRGALPSGGSLIVSPTPALIAIDVNSGAGAGRGGNPRRLNFETNLEAARAVPRLLRLLNLAGQILVDFLPMNSRADGGRVLDAMRESCLGDPTACHVIGFTTLGLVEMTRARSRPSLLETLGVVCDSCDGDGRVRSDVGVAFDALRRVPASALAARGRTLELTARPAVIEALGGVAAEALASVEARLGRPLRLTSDPAFGGGRFEIAPARTGEGDDG